MNWIFILCYFSVQIVSVFKLFQPLRLDLFYLGLIFLWNTTLCGFFVVVWLGFFVVFIYFYFYFLAFPYFLTTSCYTSTLAYISQNYHYMFQPVYNSTPGITPGKELWPWLVFTGWLRLSTFWGVFASAPQCSHESKKNNWFSFCPAVSLRMRLLTSKLFLCWYWTWKFIYVLLNMSSLCL